LSGNTGLDFNSRWITRLLSIIGEIYWNSIHHCHQLIIC
jgi:hypothetical protein